MVIMNFLTIKHNVFKPIFKLSVFVSLRLLSPPFAPEPIVCVCMWGALRPPIGSNVLKIQTSFTEFFKIIVFFYFAYFNIYYPPKPLNRDNY